ncbi:MAG: L,D-transpeptidase family protein [Pseudomonadota bacterium]
MNMPSQNRYILRACVLHVSPDLRIPVQVGCGGVAQKIREGDGITPVGVWSVLRVRYRADRIDRPQTTLPTYAIAPDDGWCDDPGHRDYNQLVKLPFSYAHETLWRVDCLYDIVVELGYNTHPIIAGAGSAIFMHVWHHEKTPTQGCVAMACDDLLQFLRTVRLGDCLDIQS